MRTFKQIAIIVSVGIASSFAVVGCSATAEAPADESVEVGDDAITLSVAGDVLMATANVNFRTGPSTGYRVITGVNAGTTVVSKGNATNGFVPVVYNGDSGYIYGAYLVRKSSGGPSTGASTPTGGGTASMPWDGKHPDAANWTRYTAEAIATYGSGLTGSVPSDVTSFCPSYPKLSKAERTQFWTGLIAGMAKFESNYNPQTKYTESFTDSSGSNVVSRGLLQLSYESAKAYGCSISSGAELHDARTNLTCTVRILNKWIGGDGVVTDSEGSKWLGGARYWSVLRKSSTLNPIISITSNLSVCRR
jgi:uncharacterized protein YraI